MSAVDSSERIDGVLPSPHTGASAEDAGAVDEPAVPPRGQAAQELFGQHRVQRQSHARQKRHGGGLESVRRGLLVVREREREREREDLVPLAVY